MKKWIWVVGLIIFGVIALFVILRERQRPKDLLTFNGQPLTVEVMRTPEEVRQGLSGREYMPLDHGMLFLFDYPDRYQFWMKDMRFPLDIIFIHEGKVVDLVTLPTPLEGEVPATYTPKEAADRVLELNAGQATVYGFTVGHPVDKFSNIR